MPKYDSRPSIWGDEVCKLSLQDQKRALGRFEQFYKVQAGRVRYSDEYSRAGGYYATVGAWEDALQNNIDKYNSENCIGFSVMLKRELERLGLPARLVWVDMSTKSDCNAGHMFVVYQYQGKNFAADLCPAIRGSNCVPEQKFMWHEQFENHAAKYCKTSFVAIQYAEYNYPINYFKEFDEMRRSMSFMTVKGTVGTPFINKGNIAEQRSYKLNKNWVPRHFEHVGIPKELPASEMDPRYKVPGEILNARGRENKNMIENYTLLGRLQELAGRGKYNAQKNVPPLIKTRTRI